MSIVYATLPLRVETWGCAGPGGGPIRYAWIVTLADDAFGQSGSLDESPAMYKTETQARTAGRKAAYRLASTLCERASGWKRP